MIPPPPADGPPDLLLVSFDTTRADAIGAWGGPPTPTVDALAAAGVRFAWMLAQSPTTLASHSTVFTGLDPHGTRVVRNGYALPDDVETLAERLAARGYDTLGVVAASALSGETGIHQGFRVWDDRLGETRKHRHEAPAADVTDRALAAMAGRTPGKPLFLFVHYYDAHAPFQAPAPYVDRLLGDRPRRFDGGEGELGALGDEIRAGTAKPEDLAEVRARYDAEVAYADAELGRLLAVVDRSRTVVALFGDHGEMLGEEPKRPFGHGPDLDLPATHVPFVLAGPGVPAGKVVEAPAGLQDVGGTVLAALGVTEPLGSSVDLSPGWTSGATPPRTWAMEASQPGHADPAHGWNNLPNERGMLEGGALLLSCPARREAPTLYRVAAGQPRLDDPAVAARLTAAQRAWDAAAPPFRAEQMSDSTREGLKALGYLQ